jgi:hypothetical protein
MQAHFDIYVPRGFQWYKESLNPMGLAFWNLYLMIKEFIGTPTP